MTKDRLPPLLDALVHIEKLPVDGRQLKIFATPEQLGEIARVAKVSNIHRLAATVHLISIKGGIKLTGELQAEAVQPCVVTLDPVLQKIIEPLSRVFSTAPDVHAEAAAGSEKFIDLESDDLPDHLDGNVLDLSAYLLEVLGLAIDLYPRAPGAQLSPEQKGDDPAALSPFSALKNLNLKADGGK